jgi:catechol 2,3-dioxygenase-like lactoylglutathione lyase family enzyme
MGQLLGFKNVVFPARDLATSVDAWTAVLGQEPAFVGEDFAVFTGAGAEVGLSSAPWVDHPLVFWEVAEIEEAHRALIAAGAVPLGEIAGGSLAEIGTADVTHGDPTTGIVDVPGGRLGVLRAADGNLVGLHQAVSFA